MKADGRNAVRWRFLRACSVATVVADSIARTSSRPASKSATMHPSSKKSAWVSIIPVSSQRWRTTFVNRRRSIGSADDDQVLFTAHSIPMGMADNCDYEKQLREASRLVAEACGATIGISFIKVAVDHRANRGSNPMCSMRSHKWTIEQKIRITDHLPIGFVSDHMEVMFDFDEEAAVPLRGTRHSRWPAPLAGTHPQFVSMIRALSKNV